MSRHSRNTTCFSYYNIEQIFYLLIFFLLISPAICDVEKDPKSCAEFYEKGVETYLENNFSECVTNFENALAKYRQFSKNLRNCRLSCKNEAENADPLYGFDVENLLFFEKTIRNTLCLIRCKAKIDGEKYVNEETEALFEKRKPYEYLHICYFQESQRQKAASAVFTYLVSNPEDKTMLATLKHYSSFEDVNFDEIVNYEAKDYVYLYSHGSAAYDQKNWIDVIDNMEESLSDFLQAEEECRAQCEGSFDHGWLPDFIPSIANHFTYCLKCKNKCYSKLNSINGEKYDDLLPSHYHYLQFAYYKVGNLVKTCEAVASFLLFYPNDAEMLANMEFYLKLPKVERNFFKPRSEAVHYFRRQTYEKKILKFIEKEFYSNLTTEALSDDFSKGEKSKFAIVETGENRFTSEGLLTKTQCRKLVKILKTFSIVGDGYNTSSPHSKMEKFEGITLERIVLLVYFGLLNPNQLKMVLEITEEAKEILTDYFELKQPLYFTYTHLVCRTSTDLSTNRSDLSHEIHADNCNIYPDGKCEKLPPSYTWRDYSAIIYLNNDFEGGEFFFSSDMRSVSPACGKMVAFSSGDENLHGVKAVRRGSRCALALWFTFDEKYAEKEREIAYNLLAMKEFS